MQEFVSFKQREDETPKKYLQRFEMLEVRLRNLNLIISDMLLAQHFLHKANLKDLTTQAILAQVNTNDEENILTNVKESFTNIVTNTSDGEAKSVYYRESGNFDRYKRRSASADGNGRSRFQQDYQDLRGRGRGNRSRSRSKSQTRGYRGRSRSSGRNKSGGERFPLRQDEYQNNVFHCKKYKFSDTDYKKRKKINNVIASMTANKAIVDSGCPSSVTGKLWLQLYKETKILQGETSHEDFVEESNDKKF